MGATKSYYRKYLQSYRLKPGYRDRARLYAAKHRRTQKRKDYLKNYYQRPETKKRLKCLRKRKHSRTMNRCRVSRYRARLRNVFILDGDLEIKRLRKSRSVICYYCRKKIARFDVDHVNPISLGGSHAAFNLVPSCPSCNRGKSGNPPNEFIKEGQLLLVF